MTGFNKADLAPFIAVLGAAIAAASVDETELSFDDRASMQAFDLHDFDTRLAAALGIEVPNDYAQRKAEEEELPFPIAPLDPMSMGRKLVAMLGEGWTWCATEGATGGTACVTSGYGLIEVRGPTPLALRLAALEAMASQ